MRIVALAGIAENAALRLAAQLKLSLPHAELTAVVVAPNGVAMTQALRQARAEGAQHLVHLWDDAFVDLDGEAMSRELMLTTALSALGRRLEARLFVVPELSCGWLGPALAEELDLPHLSAVLNAEVTEGGNDPIPSLVVRRRCLRGVQRLRGPAIGVLCVLPSPRSKEEAPLQKTAKKDNFEVDTWDLLRLGLGAVDLPRPLLRPPTPERRSELSGRTFASLQTLATRLRQDGLSPDDKEG